MGPCEGGLAESDPNDGDEHRLLKTSEVLPPALPPLRPFSDLKGAWGTWNTWAGAHLVTLEVTERLHGDGLEGRLPTELEGHHLLPSLLQPPHHVLVLVQGLLLVLGVEGSARVRPRSPPQAAGREPGKGLLGGHHSRPAPAAAAQSGIGP